jgi:hypothetical protein
MVPSFKDKNKVKDFFCMIEETDEKEFASDEEVD